MCIFIIYIFVQCILSTLPPGQSIISWVWLFGLQSIWWFDAFEWIFGSIHFFFSLWVAHFVHSDNTSDKITLCISCVESIKNVRILNTIFQSISMPFVSLHWIWTTTNPPFFLLMDDSTCASTNEPH